MARSNPSSAQYQREVTGGGTAAGKANTPPGRSARYTPADSGGARRAGSARGPETNRQAEGPGKRQGPDISPYPSAVQVRAARLRQHASAEVDASDRFPAQRPEDPHASAGATAHVQSPAERAERAQRAGRRAEHATAGAERRAVELRGKKVIAALDRRQRLHRQFTHGRALRREHPKGTYPTPDRRPAPRSPTAPRGQTPINSTSIAKTHPGQQTPPRTGARR